MKHYDAQKIKEYVKNRFKRYGKNKKQEIARLLFEISKKEKCDYKDIIGNTNNTEDFLTLKKYVKVEINSGFFNKK